MGRLNRCTTVGHIKLLVAPLSSSAWRSGWCSFECSFTFGFNLSGLWYEDCAWEHSPNHGCVIRV